MYACTYAYATAHININAIFAHTLKLFHNVVPGISLGLHYVTSQIYEKCVLAYARKDSANTEISAVNKICNLMCPADKMHIIFKWLIPFWLINFNPLPLPVHCFYDGNFYHYFRFYIKDKYDVRFPLIILWLLTEFYLRFFFCFSFPAPDEVNIGILRVLPTDCRLTGSDFLRNNCCLSFGTTVKYTHTQTHIYRIHIHSNAFIHVYILVYTRGSL